MIWWTGLAEVDGLAERVLHLPRHHCLESPPSRLSPQSRVDEIHRIATHQQDPSHQHALQFVRCGLVCGSRSGACARGSRWLAERVLHLHHCSEMGITTPSLFAPAASSLCVQWFRGEIVFEADRLLRGSRFGACARGSRWPRRTGPSSASLFRAI